VPNFRSKVTRANEIRVIGQTMDGSEIALDAKGMLAICLQHEIDHLEGTLFIDRISNLKRTLYDRKVRKWMKKSETTSI
jgi:peptide deformylase